MGDFGFFLPENEDIYGPRKRRRFRFGEPSAIAPASMPTPQPMQGEPVEPRVELSEAEQRYAERLQQPEAEQKERPLWSKILGGVSQFITGQDIPGEIQATSETRRLHKTQRELTTLREAAEEARAERQAGRQERESRATVAARTTEAERDRAYIESLKEKPDDKHLGFESLQTSTGPRRVAVMQRPDGTVYNKEIGEPFKADISRTLDEMLTSTDPEERRRAEEALRIKQKYEKKPGGELTAAQRTAARRNRNNRLAELKKDWVFSVNPKSGARSYRNNKLRRSVSEDEYAQMQEQIESDYEEELLAGGGEAPGREEPVGTKTLDAVTAHQILDEAGGDPEKATALARRRGYKILTFGK